MNRTHLHRIKLWDKAARWVITLGGVFIIMSVLAILAMIAKVTAPLFMPAKARLLYSHTPPIAARSDPVLAIGADEGLVTGFILNRQGNFRFIDLKSNATMDQSPAAPPTSRARVVVSAESYGNLLFNLLWDDGSLTIEQVKFFTEFDKEGRRIERHRVDRLKALSADPKEPKPVRSVVRVAEDGRLTQVSLLPDQHFLIARQVASTDYLGETTTETFHGLIQDSLPGPVSAFAVDRSGSTLYAGTENGVLLRWTLGEKAEPVLQNTVQAFSDGRAITALAFVLGDISLAVGDGRGGLSTWFHVPSPRRTGRGELKKIHVLASHASAVAVIIPSPRDKSLLSIGQNGSVHLDHMTSERHLIDLGFAIPLKMAALTPRAGGMIGLDENQRIIAWEIRNPHPEVSWRTLFGKVWYESYPKPDYVWQSSSASDDFEPKLSLVPLIFGTFKGTFYAMLFAAPLAVLGALYTSQFMRPGLRRVVKPAVEIMAAIPSVVLGFLAALWLAPALQSSVVGLFLCFVLIPAALLVALIFWQGIEGGALAKRWGRGCEFLILIPVILAGAGAALWLGPLIESRFFHGSFTQWLFNSSGMRYDQRNCVIIAFALGFAVIPIIFTIAEDSMGNIPRSLTAASLALGASRWQTAWRVILPSASPGIFAGIMIGLGRAVGETMIVLMATGNTPIMSGSPFDGMRTLSANIAVEIPEAPIGGTLYRVLFLTAVLLFLSTFVLNTAAEVVRQRLRKRYGQL